MQKRYITKSKIKIQIVWFLRLAVFALNLNLNIVIYGSLCDLTKRIDLDMGGGRILPGENSVGAWKNFFYMTVAELFPGFFFSLTPSSPPPLFPSHCPGKNAAGHAQAER